MEARQGVRADDGPGFEREADRPGVRMVDTKLKV